MSLAFSLEIAIVYTPFENFVRLLLGSYDQLFHVDFSNAVSGTKQTVYYIHLFFEIQVFMPSKSSDYAV